jgi:sRNA-binding protein
MTRRHIKIAETRYILAERFPLAFKHKKEHKVPLAIGIHRQIFEAAPDLSRKLVRDALHDYCAGYKYLQHIETGRLRVNLDGSTSGIISIEQSAHARAEVEKLMKTWRSKKRRPAPRQQQKKAA